MSQAEGQQKNLVHSIDSLPTRGPLSCLDQDLLLLKATSAATLSCLGECLNILQQTQSRSQAPPQPSERHPAPQRAPSGESASVPTPVLLLDSSTPPPIPFPLSVQPPAPEPSSSDKVVHQQPECESCPAWWLNWLPMFSKSFCVYFWTFCSICESFHLLLFSYFYLLLFFFNSDGALKTTKPQWQQSYRSECILARSFKTFYMSGNSHDT